MEYELRCFWSLDIFLTRVYCYIVRNPSLIACMVFQYSISKHLILHRFHVLPLMKASLPSNSRVHRIPLSIPLSAMR